MMINGEKTECFPSRIKNHARLSVLLLLYNIRLEALAMAIRQGKEIKSIQMGRESKPIFVCS
jgi:hypothetical protein